MKESDENPPVRNIPPFGLRLQPDLKGRLDQRAKDDGISLNKLISKALEDVFPPSGAVETPITIVPSAELRVYAEISAKSNGRSLEAEIIDLMQEAYPPEDAINEIKKWLDATTKAAEEIEGDQANRILNGLSFVSSGLDNLRRIPVKKRL